MTESDWIAYDDPQAALVGLGDRVSGRKLRLFACACARRVWPAVEDQCRPAITTAEDQCDRLATAEQVAYQYDFAAGGAGDSMSNLAAAACCNPDPARAASLAAELALSMAVEDACGELFRTAGPDTEPLDLLDEVGGRARRREQDAQLAMLRCVFGNPFSPGLAGGTWGTPGVASIVQLAGLSRAAYEDRLPPSGTLDAARLSVLADALEENGCTDAELVGHLRSPGPHVRGCWALDLILGLG